MTVCEIAEEFGRQIGMRDFEIDRIVHARDENRDEWVVHLAVRLQDPSIEEDNFGALIVVDAQSGTPRLLESL